MNCFQSFVLVVPPVFILAQSLSGSDSFMAHDGRQGDFFSNLRPLLLSDLKSIAKTHYPFSKGEVLKLWHPAESSCELFPNTYSRGPSQPLNQELRLGM